VLQQAREALVQAVLAAAQEAAAAETQKAQDCCGVPGCEHTHDHKRGEEGDASEEEPEHEQDRKRSKESKAADGEKQTAAAGGAAQGFSFNFAL
jgi:hypothetical protein